jgi:two-component system sensor histidine kinase ChvG
LLLLAIGGGSLLRIPSDLAWVARRAFASLTIKLVVLIGVFVALPIVLYGQFEMGDRKMRDLVARGIQQQSWLIAQALKPVLGDRTMPSQSVLDGELAKYAADGTTLDLMFRPAGVEPDHGFYYVASTASGRLDQLDEELDGLLAHGVLARLSHTCSWDVPSELRYVASAAARAGTGLRRAPPQRDSVPPLGSLPPARPAQSVLA